MYEKLERAKFWLDKDFQILPCQPDTKMLVSGFGQYLNKIKDEREASKFYGYGSSANMAVLAPNDVFILDFDKISVFAKWAEQCPAAAQAYTEGTPRGGRHVWIRGEVPSGVQLIEGAEIKKIVLVSPSKIGENSYKIISERPFYCGDVLSVLFPLSKTGHATPYALKASHTRASASNPNSHIDQIKKHFTISHVLKTYRPEIKFSGRGDFQNCACPFHKDSKPSFWFNDLMGLWGCHACNVRGDVINLYARFEVVNVREAITLMWAVMA